MIIVVLVIKKKKINSIEVKVVKTKKINKKIKKNKINDFEKNVQ